MFSQVRIVNSTANSSVSNSSTFIDVSSNPTINAGTNVGKGLLFPATDLTTFASFSANGPAGPPTNFPTYFDGFIVYNTATGTSSIGSVAVTPGYYYYSNPGQTFPSGTTTSGVWTAMGGATSSLKLTTVTGVTADGINATLDLGTATIAANEVVRFRSAKVYDASNNLVIEASSDYDKATNIFTTGNGLLNSLLPAGTYSVVVEFD
jgi:hypothetical protein